MRFLFVLARDLGKSAAEVSRLGAREIAHWRALYTLEAREREAELAALETRARDGRAIDLMKSAGRGKRSGQGKG
ncbi:MAG: hypothetical protein ABL308_12680 [Oceanicaulis sp.]